MISLQELRQLPADPYLAWATLEEKLRAKLNASLETHVSEYDDSPIDVLKDALEYQRYLNAYAKQKDLELFIDGMEYSTNSVDDLKLDIVREILADGAQQAGIAAARIVSWEGSEIGGVGEVAIPRDARPTILDYCDQIRRTIFAADLEKPVESKILRSLRSFEKSVEDMRTSIAKVGQVWTDVCAAVGDGAEKLEPAINQLERIARLMRRHQNLLPDGTDAQAQLPAP